MDIEKIMKELTLAEKASLVSGNSSWTVGPIERAGVPEIFVSDGPYGLRKQESDTAEIYDSIDAVAFPTSAATASSFDKDLMYEIGTALGKECQAENVAVILGPGINIKRSPLCGRNFEYISEDPYVAGEMSAALINGVQSQDIGTSLKHFAANSQETERMYASSDMDERTLREIYLAGYETAVKKSNPWTLMCSYNRINGTYASENKWLLTDVLRDEWGYDGLVMSDWGAVSDRIKGIAAGLDLEMPGSGGVNDARIVEAVETGKLDEADLDKAVRNVLNLMEKYHSKKREEVFDRDKDHEIAVHAEEESIVLLKNEDVLPIKAEEKIAIIGGFAENPRFQGGGSSHINAHNIVSAVSVADSFGSFTYTEGFPYDGDQMSDEMKNQAVEAAKNADKVVVFAGLPDSYECEGYDRSHMRLPECQNILIDELLKLSKPVIIVLHNGSPVEMPWADYVDGIVEAYLGGEGVGEAVMKVLYGKVNPSGKLAESFPKKVEDNPSYLSYLGQNHRCNYSEGIFVGYRYYDTKKMDVLFPFGFGLSYTTFDYSNLKVSVGGSAVSGAVDINADKITVSVDITNTGNMAGKEIVQLYISDKTKAAIRPVHELKGFEKIALNPGETGTVSFELDKRSFAWFNEAISDWYAAGGEYVIEIGKSSRDIVLTETIEVKGDAPVLPVIDMDVQIGDLLKNDITKNVVLRVMKEEIQKFSGSDGLEVTDMDPMTYAMLQYLPIRTLRSFTHMTNERVESIVAALKEEVEKVSR